MSQVSIGRTINSLRAVVLTGFIIFSDDILAWYLGLSRIMVWTVVAICFLSIYAVIRATRRWPEWFKQRRDAIRSGLGEVRFVLFAFLFAGVSKAWYRTDLGLTPFFLAPGVWLVLGLQVFTLDLIVTLQYPQVNLSGRVFKFYRQLVKAWIGKVSAILPIVVARPLERYLSTDRQARKLFEKVC